MYSLNCVDGFRISSPENTYVYDIVSVGAHIAVISSDDSLRILDPLALNSPAVNSIRKVNTDVTCLKALGTESGGVLVCTAGRDGVVGMMDLRTASIVGRVKSDQNAPILSLATSGPYGIAAGTELANHQATLSLWDIRNLETPVVSYIESHSDDVTELQFHPTRPQILLSGSTDGLVNIYNTTITDEEEALHQTINHGSSIHHANFLNETDIFALSHDEKFSMYELVTNPDEGVEEPLPNHFGDMRERLHGEYVVNILSRPDGGAVIGLGTHSQERLDLIQFAKGGSWDFSPDTKVTLPGAHSSEIIRTFCFLDEHKIVLTAGEDGFVKAWKGD